MSKVEYLHASNKRILAMIVRNDFDDFSSHPPTFETEEERAWLEKYYQVKSPEQERTTKAHITSEEFPMQITVLNRGSNSFVKPHWHINERPPENESRHQVMICMKGSARIGVFDREGPHIADVDIYPGDLILLCEGHSVETLEEDTRLIEIKQGPMPEDPFADNVSIEKVEDKI